MKSLCINHTERPLLGEYGHKYAPVQEEESQEGTDMKGRSQWQWDSLHDTMAGFMQGFWRMDMEMMPGFKPKKPKK